MTAAGRDPPAPAPEAAPAPGAAGNGAGAAPGGEKSGRGWRMEGDGGTG